jgi:hypothetical protein
MDKNFVDDVRQMMDITNNTHFGTSIVSDEYAPKIFDAIAEDVAEDIKASADAENFNNDDIRLAVGRVLAKRLGIEI